MEALEARLDGSEEPRGRWRFAAVGLGLVLLMSGTAAAAPALQTSPESDPAEVLRSEIAAVVEGEMLRVSKRLEEVDALLVSGKIDEARIAIKSIRSRNEELRVALRWSQGLKPADAVFLSMVKVRIASARSRWGLSQVQTVEAEIVEAAVVGGAYYPYTLNHMILPPKNREDLETGKVIPLEAWRSNRMGTVQSGSTLITRRNVGELYWVVITPPRRVKGWQPPRVSSHIVFRLRVGAGEIDRDRMSAVPKTDTTSAQSPVIHWPAR
jgi:hypothetical protein